MRRTLNFYFEIIHTFRSKKNIAVFLDCIAFFLLFNKRQLNGRNFATNARKFDPMDFRKSDSVFIFLKILLSPFSFFSRAEINDYGFFRCALGGWDVFQRKSERLKAFRKKSRQ